MDVEKLEKILQEITGEDDVKPFIKTIAHWAKRIKASNNKFVTDNHKEAESLKKLSELRIIKIDIKPKDIFEEVTAILTEEGEELSKDFFMKGFYL
ncbi:MAG: hypothetical protein HY514_01690 [Candidatus Aenigmarchaeota archaeon]|nr:hypothetical protein [Candidatus Aenigmarchaeota archaeon]